MSKAMDFSDMFRPDAGRPASKPRLNTTKRAPAAGAENQVQQENQPPMSNVQNNISFADSDSLAHVKHALRNMNVEIQDKDLTQPAVRAIEMLYSERIYWQKQTTSVSEECVKLRNQLSQTHKEKVGESDTVEALKRDNQGLLGRISAMTLEHRETRNHWAAEKNDLLTRIFQVQAQNTQVMGTLKKKEKDFEKLQNQLAKLVKDSSRGQAKPSIVMSLPVKKNLSQGPGEQGTAASILKDSEMQAAKKTITSLDAENQTLRGTIESLQQSLDELHDAFEQAVQQSEVRTRQHLESLLAEHHAAIDAKDKEIAALQQRVADLAKPYDLDLTRAGAGSSCPTIPEEAVPQSPAPVAAPVRVPPATPSASTAHKAPLEFMSPSQLRNTMKLRAAPTPGSIARRYLEGTPGARPVQWVVEQANTEVKKLRARAEQIAKGEGGAAALASLDGYSAWVEMGHGAEGVAAGAGALALWRMKLHAMKLRFSEALLVIQEQDRLIHSALLGRPVGMSDDYHHVSAARSPDAADSPAVVTVASVTTAKGGLPERLQDSDFLPPASPETWALLQSYGWSCLPNKLSPSNSEAAATVEVGAAKTTLANEFDAED